MWLKGNWTICSKYANDSMFNSQCNLGDLRDHDLMSMRIFTLIMYKIFIWGFVKYEANGHGHNLNKLIILI